MVEVSNADRVVFPGSGITKGDVVAYYSTVADRMMPFVVGRALTIERYPKGTGAEGFMQKNAPNHLSEDLIGRHEVTKEDGGTTTYAVIRDAEAIVAFANLGVITFHAPPSKVDDLRHADWIIWDLDPPSGEFDKARRAAHALRSVLIGFGIETAIMTSGSNGYHLRAHLDPVLPGEEAAAIARGTAALAEEAHPDLMTLAFRKEEREGRVFLDWLRNAPYSTSVVPWSVRARDGAPVAVPIAWDEVDALDPNGVHLGSARDRFGLDPWGDHPPLDLRPTSAAVVAALDEVGIALEPFDRFRS